MNKQTTSTTLSGFTVKCPTCHKDVEWSEKNPFRPFCSKRCQLIDLGEWAAEEHRIPDDDAAAMEEDRWSEDDFLSSADKGDRL
ncbi:DNA gyrase inhibitor YacG [Orbaceae bacterium ESL0727]|nr:DNA gyrase inhibitor YacG [Orbaceae bacterium ESL0727]